jgi:hypothetical protein
MVPRHVYGWVVVVDDVLAEKGDDVVIQVPDLWLTRSRIPRGVLDMDV